MDRRAATPQQLTARQEQILTCIGEGLSNREIGHRLGLAEKTVKNSVTGILAALGVRRRVQAAVYAATHRGSPAESAGERPTRGIS